MTVGMPWRRGRSVAATRGILCACALAVMLSAARSHARAPIGLTEAIARQPLAGALAAFARQTGLQLVYVSSIARGRMSNGAPAGLTRSAALTRLLDGTGLKFQVLNERSVRILADSSWRPSARAPPGPEHAPYGPSTGLEEIIVTASARPEPSDRVPIVISVWTQGNLEAAGVKRIEDLAALEPGVYYYQNLAFGSGIGNYFIMRGLSSRGGWANTSIFVDDTPLHLRNSSVSYFGDILPVTFDLERVEVLHGPQGTLGGDAAEGGAIRFITTAPSLTDFSGIARAEVATTERGAGSYEAGAAVGGPIIPEELGFRVSLWTRYDGGYVDRVDPFTSATLDANANWTSTTSIRAALAVAPSDTVRITPSFAYQSEHLNDSPAFYPYLSAPSAGIFLNGKLLRQPVDDSFSVSSLKAAVDFPSAQLTTISAYSRRTGQMVYDATNYVGVGYANWGNPLGRAYPTSYLDAAPMSIDLVQTSLSEEIRLTSTDRAARLSWLAGGWFARATEDQSTAVVPVDPSLRNLYGGYQRGTASITQTDVFGQLDWKITDRLRGNAGARVSHNQFSTSQYASGPFNLGYPPAFNAQATSTPVAPQIGLSYTPEQYGVVYVSIAKGYRLGGVNYPPATGCTQPYPPTYGPDSLWSYEAGIKARPGAGSMQVDFALFHLMWHDVQQSIYTCSQGFSMNAGSAESDGFDLTARLTVLDRLRMGTAIEYADARYTTTTRFGQGYLISAGDALGFASNVAPPWSVSTWIDADLFRTARQIASVRIDSAFHSHNARPLYTENPANNQYSPYWRADPATELVNFRLRSTWAHFEFSAFLTNVFDSQPVLQIRSDVPSSSLTYASTFRPRSMGASVSVRF